jgi:hypothetical protein
MSDSGYWHALEKVCGLHGDAMAQVLRLRPGYLRTDELTIVVNFCLEHSLRQLFDAAGFLRGGDVLSLLRALPTDQRHPRTAVNALQWYDRSGLLNRKLPAVVARGPLFQPSIEWAFRGQRRSHTEHSLRRVLENHRALADAIDGLVDQLGHPNVTVAATASIRGQLRKIQGLIRSSEWHARTAAGWAIKNDFPTDRVGDGLFRIYIRPLRRTASLLKALEDRLKLNNGPRCSASARRAARRIALELMDAAAARPPNAGCVDPKTRTA